jgi:DNA-binding transcriptional MerR regulator
LESGPGLTVTGVATRTISRAAADAGVSPDTLRYYERVGLLSPPERSAGGYRMYDGSTTDRVRLIKGGQGLGLRLDSIRALLAMLDRGACPCGDALLIAVRCGGTTAGRPDEGVSWLSPLSSHAAARTRRAAASFESQPNRRQGILETARQALGRYEQPVAPAEHSPSGQYALRCRGRIWCSVRGEMR